MPKRKLGWKPDVPDFRDLSYSAHRMKAEKPRVLPKSIDFRDKFPVVYDQGDLGSCTAQAIAAALEYNRAIQGITTEMDPSRLFIYYNERKTEGTINEDAGAYIRTGIKSVVKEGYCHEGLWPYDISKFKVAPPVACYEQAKKYKAMSYYRIDNTNLLHLRSCLAAKYPIVFGAMLYTSFEQADSNGGFVPVPKPTDNDDGGHCMLMIGYDDEKKLFAIRNSWGSEVGDKGHYYMPYEYIINPNLCDDFWTIRSVVEG